MTPDSVSCLIMILLFVTKAFVRVSSNFPVLNINPADRRYINPRLQLEEPRPVSTLCLFNNKWIDCLAIPSKHVLSHGKNGRIANNRENLSLQLYQAHDMQPGLANKAQQALNERLSVDRSLKPLNLRPMYGNAPQMTHAPQYRILWPRNRNRSVVAEKRLASSLRIPIEKFSANRNISLNKRMQNVDACKNGDVIGMTIPCAPRNGSNNLLRVLTPNENKKKSSKNSKNDSFLRFRESLDAFERKFYELTFTKLSSNCPKEKQENGISFIQSGLFLHLLLMTICVDLDPKTRREIEKCLGVAASNTETAELIKNVTSSLPVSSEALKFRWSSRVVLGALNASQELRTGAASAMNLQVDHLNGTETPEILARSLNRMVEMDSGGAMHDTFDEDEVSNGTCAVLLSTVYVRGRWRAAPTLLNDTCPFRDADAPQPQRSTRMIRINDIMRYADLSEWDAEALEISYATPGLSLLMLVPRGRSLRALAAHAAATSLRTITARMNSMRVAATVPLYTLRMTLLLPSKLQAMGISRLMEPCQGGADGDGGLRLSHAVQRLMFWSEAGRNAFKDDGIEWDEPPEQELLVDRPYVFFVRWRNITLMNGNFVL